MVLCKTSDCHRRRRLRYGSPDLCRLRARRTRRPEFTFNQLLNLFFLLFSPQAWDSTETSPSLSSYEACTTPQVHRCSEGHDNCSVKLCDAFSLSRTGRLKSHILLGPFSGSISMKVDARVLMRKVFQDLGYLLPIPSQWPSIRA